MVHRTVADVVFVDKCNDVGNGLRVVGSVTVDFHIEDVAAACQVVVRSFHFRLVARAAFIPNGNVVRVRVIVLVGHALDDAERAFVLFCELTRQPLGRCGKNAEIVLIAFREFVGTVAHVGNDFQAQLLAFFAFAVVFARKCHQTFRQSDKTDAQRALIDDAFYRVVRLKFFRTVPQFRHQQRKLFGQCRFLEIIAFAQLFCRRFQHRVQFFEECVDTFLAVFDVHAFNGEAYDVDGRERKVTAADRSFLAEAVFKHTGAASHRCHFIPIAERVVGIPFFVFVERSVEVEEVREETACRNLAGELEQVVVAILRQIVHAAFLFPYLNRENGRRAVAHTFVGGVEQFAHHAAAFRRCVRTVVDGAEHNLIATTRVDGVHIVDKRFHGLVYAFHSLVDGVLQRALFACQSVERLLDEVVELDVVKVGVVFAGKRFRVLHLFDERTAHKRCEVEIESRNGLAAVHFVLCRFHGDTADDACRFDAFCRARFPMSGIEAVVQNLVERMLHASEALSRIVILVMHVQVAVSDSFHGFRRQEIVVDERFGSFAGKLHHHARR